MKNILSTFVLAGLAMVSVAQKPKTLAERLGYPPNTRLLIIHADDLAAAHAENEASFKALQQGNVSSASVMVPCPWFSEVAAYARAHPNHDLGLHLTLTSEWTPYKWGPVASRNEVPSLVDSNGFFYNLCEGLGAHAKIAEIEKELRAQIARAKAMGLEPTHFDSHMRCLFDVSPETFGLYLRLGREFHVPVMVGQNFLNEAPESLRKLVTPQDIVVDYTLTASPEDYQGGMAKYYTDLIKNLKPGVTVLVMHTAYSNEETQAMTSGFPGMWDAGWRQADFNFFTSEACTDLLKSQGVKLITWREVGKLLR